MKKWHGFLIDLFEFDILIRNGVGQPSCYNTSLKSLQFRNSYIPIIEQKETAYAYSEDDHPPTPGNRNGETTVSVVVVVVVVVLEVKSQSHHSSLSA